jgi:hypothetical protein
MHVDRACDSDGLNHGCVFCWHGDGDARIGISWDWSEIMPGVISIVDPFGIRSNVLLTDDSGAPLPDMAAVIDINTMIYTLGWQERVQAICAVAA